MAGRALRVVDTLRWEVGVARVAGWAQRVDAPRLGERSSTELFKAKFHYASWFEAGRRQVRSQIPLRYLVRSCFEAGHRRASNLQRPTSVMEFDFYQLKL